METHSKAYQAFTPPNNFAQACNLIDNTDWNNLLFVDDVNISTLN